MPHSHRSPRRLGERLADQIEQLIAQDAMEPGTALVERALAARLMVSRSPVREALRRLAKRDAVGLRPDGGYTVRSRPDSTPFAPGIANESRQEPTYLAIAEDWLAGRLPERVSENLLMRRYGLTRIRLGSILHRIANEGWIERRPGHGWQFRPVLTSDETYDQAYRFRILLEPAALHEPRFKLDEAALRQCLAQQQALIDGAVQWASPAQLFDANTHLHETIAACSGNIFIVESLKRINRLRRLMEYRKTVDREAAARRCREHQTLIELLLGGERQAAADFIRLHLRHAAWDKAMGHAPTLDD